MDPGRLPAGQPWDDPLVMTGDRVAAILKESMEEVDVGPKEMEEVLQVIESARDDILGR